MDTLGDGYADLGNGLKIRWGYEGRSLEKGTVTFNQPFETINYSVSFMCFDIGGGTGGESITFAQNVQYNTANFTFQCRNGSGGSRATNFTWIAIGI